MNKKVKKGKIRKFHEKRGLKITENCIFLVYKRFPVGAYCVHCNRVFVNFIIESRRVSLWQVDLVARAEGRAPLAGCCCTDYCTVFALGHTGVYL